VPELLAHAAEPRLELSPADAERLGLADGDPARVRSARGEFVMRVAQSDALPSGVAFAPMHFGHARASGGPPNLVMHGALDPASKQPELKHAAIRVERLVRPTGRVVIVGAGRAGTALAERLRALDPAREIVLLGGEPHAPYDRMRLAEVVSGAASAQDLSRFDEPSVGALDLDLRLGARVVAIDAPARCVTLACGTKLAYDALVLATGARPVRTRVAGSGLDRARVLWSLEDVLALRGAGLVGRRVVVWGTGRQGVALADALVTAGARVTLLGRGGRLLRRHADARAAALVEAALVARGIRLRLEEEVEAFVGEGHLRAVRLRSGEAIYADDVVLAHGVEGELALARAAGLQVSERVLVDAQLRTSDSQIFALGAAAELASGSPGFASASSAQAETLARVLAGDETARLRPVPVLTRLTLKGIRLQACGALDENEDPEREDARFEDAPAGVYRRLVLRRGRPVGFVAVGPCPNATALLRALESGLRLREPADVLLHERVGAEGDLASRLAAVRTICSCHAVGDAQIRRAIHAGARTVAAVGAACAAGTGCGSCRPEIARLLRMRTPAREREPSEETNAVTQTASAPSPFRVVVIGNGMVGQRFLESLREQDALSRLQLTVLCEEPRPAYDRVHLSDLFAGKTPDDLALTTTEWFSEEGIELRLGERALEIDREACVVRTDSGAQLGYDALVLATGSSPFVPPVPGSEKAGVFVYRTIEDLEQIRAFGTRCLATSGAPRRAVVIGGGLLGLEAAKAARDMGFETHVVEAAKRLMPRQLDEAGSAALERRLEALGLVLHVGVSPEAFAGGATVDSVRFQGGEALDVDLVIVSAGIRPRDELAAAAGLVRGERGGVVVDDALATSDPRIFAIGEVACHAGIVYGLVAPGYEMAETLAARLTGRDTDPEAADAKHFRGADLSTKLKLLGVDVASFGDPFATGAALRPVVYEDAARDVYARLVIDLDADRLVGGILVGDTAAYLRLLQATREATALPERLEELLFGTTGAAPAEETLSDGTLVCSCNNVSCGAIRGAIAKDELRDVAALKKATRAGTGCGGCVPSLETILKQELAARGVAASNALCEHFAYSRQELFQIVKIKELRSFDALLASHGSGAGCEVCKPAAASILASLWNEPIQEQATIQDTNDRFLANIQRGGTYSVVPRVPGGEITPEKLIVLGEVAKRFGLYCKITGGQRIDLLGARVDQLPEIWADLVAAGFESGHAYGKAMRTVKSCVGSTWCRYGVQDSTALAIRIEERYRGLRSPHKLKSAVSGCIRECAEAQSKDFGIIATEQGWNLYVCGNGGSKPRHAELLAADLDEDTLIRYCDRFLMFYIQTADRLMRTARWLESLPGGIDYLRSVVIEDRLGIALELEAMMQRCVDSYACEWKQVVESPELRRRFRHFANTPEPDDSLRFVEERGQKRPADWQEPQGPEAAQALFEDGDLRWIPLVSEEEVPRDGGIAVRYGDAQIALFHFAARGAWYATQNACPHTRDMVLARGLLGDERGVPKLACPQHKKTFSLESGEGLSDPGYRIAVFPVRVEDGKVMVLLPPARTLMADAGCDREGVCHGGGCDGA
jgi:nitrite reductase (NADH) large subunit